MSVSDRVRAIIEPIVASQDLELFDLEQAGPIVRVTIDRPGGVDVEAITSTTRALSRALDEHDPIAGNYTLEVSSPGLERALRTPRHWEWAANRQVAIKTMPNYPAGRRFVGTVTASNDSNVTVALDEPVGESITIDYSDIEKARTIFVWAATPKPGGPKNRPKAATQKKSTKEDKVQP